MLSWYTFFKGTLKTDPIEYYIYAIYLITTPPSGCFGYDRVTHAFA